MGFFEVIRMIIFFIILMIAWFIGRLIVLKSIKVGLPALPPSAVWQTLYNVILEVCKAIFHYILIFLLIMWIIYWIIKKFIPNFPIPFKTILLAITPLYELRVAGIFNLFDAVFMAIFSALPIPNRLLLVGNAVGNFLSKSVLVFSYELQKKTGVKTSAVSKPPPPQPDFGENDVSGEPTDDANFFPNENRYVDKEFQQCIAENYVEPAPDATNMEKISAQVKNSQARTICNIKKMGAHSTITAEKLKAQLESSF